MSGKIGSLRRTAGRKNHLASRLWHLGFNLGIGSVLGCFVACEEPPSPPIPPEPTAVDGDRGLLIEELTDISTARSLRRSSPDRAVPVAQTAATGRLWSLSRNGRIALEAASPDRFELRLWDVEQGAAIAATPVAPAGPRAIALSGVDPVMLDAQGQLVFPGWDVAVTSKVPPSPCSGTALAADPDRRLIIAGPGCAARYQAGAWDYWSLPDLTRVLSVTILDGVAIIVGFDKQGAPLARAWRSSQPTEGAESNTSATPPSEQGAFPRDAALKPDQLTLPLSAPPSAEGFQPRWADCASSLSGELYVAMDGLGIQKFSADGKLMGNAVPIPSTITDLRMIPAIDRFLALSTDAVLSQGDLQTGKTEWFGLLRKGTLREPPRFLGVSKTGKRTLLFLDKVVAIETTSWRYFPQMTNATPTQPLDLSWDSSGNRLVVSSGMVDREVFRPLVTVIDLSLQPVTTVPIGIDPLPTDAAKAERSIAISPDGHWIAAETASSIQIIDGKTLVRQGSLETSDVVGLTFSRDSESVLTASSSGEIRKWESSGDEQGLRVVQYSGAIQSFSGNSTKGVLISGAENTREKVGVLEVLEDERYRILHNIPLFAAPRRVALADRGTAFAAVIPRVGMRAFSLPSGQPIGLLESETARSLAFNPSGKNLYFGESGLRNWNLVANTVETLNRLPGRLTALDVHPSGLCLATGDSSGRISIYDLRGNWLARFLIFGANRWIATTSEGVFATSEGGTEFLRLIVGRSVFSPEQVANLADGKRLQAFIQKECGGI